MPVEGLTAKCCPAFMSLRFVTSAVASTLAANVCSPCTSADVASRSQDVSTHSEYAAVHVHSSSEEKIVCDTLLLASH